MFHSGIRRQHERPLCVAARDHAFHQTIATWLEDASVVEVMLNSDGWRAVRMKIKQIQEVPDFIDQALAGAGGYSARTAANTTV
jgi:hypothetical protein